VLSINAFSLHLSASGTKRETSVLSVSHVEELLLLL
jgi:hypothetical protein